MKKQKTTIFEALGVIVIAIIFVVIVMQGDRIWEMLERLTKVETTVEILHERN